LRLSGTGRLWSSFAVAVPAVTLGVYLLTAAGEMCIGEWVTWFFLLASIGASGAGGWCARKLRPNTSMERIATTSPEFLSAVEPWFGEKPEILLLVRYAYAAGNRDIELIPTLDAFRVRMASLAPKTSVTAFRDHTLPLRGIVDDAFIARCLSSIPDGVEYVIVETKPKVAGSYSWIHQETGTSHKELLESLEGERGESVVAGEYRPWLADSDGIVTAYVPDADGVVRPGAY